MTKELNEIDDARSSVLSAMTLDPKNKVSFLVKSMNLGSKAQNIRKEFRTLVGEQIKTLPSLIRCVIKFLLPALKLPMLRVALN